jgi:apolipoprotein D and lipocalin family protein
MLNKTITLLAATLTSTLASAADVTPVSALDVPRYMGLWYEIAAIPQIFQTGCRNTTATYTLQEDGSVEVVNQCRLLWSSGFPLSATGRATIPNPMEPAKLKVSFFGSQADYWVLALAPDYSYALVGDPARRSLWILSREKTMSEATYDKLVALAKEQEFDTGKLKKSVQE